MPKPPNDHRKKELALLAEHAKRNRETMEIERRKVAAMEERASRVYKRPPFNESKAGAGPPENKALTGADLSDKSKDELEQMAANRGLTVERGDGKDGEPLKADYVRALSG